MNQDFSAMCGAILFIVVVYLGVFFLRSKAKSDPYFQLFKRPKTNINEQLP